MNPQTSKAIPKEIVDRLPKSVDRYQVIDHLGMGGSGVVVLAFDPETNKRVAVKITNLAWFLDKSEEELHREFAILKRLNHPNIVQVLDAGWSNGFWFIVYEYVPGKTLDEVIEETRVPYDYTIELGIQLADAIQYGHLSGVIHRDIKPSNIIIDGDMNVKLLDYGIAKTVGLTEEHGSTKTGMVRGTLKYMAPEQEDGQLDHRSDIYSLGVVLKEMLVGPEEDVEVKIPTDLGQVCRKASDKNPARRYQNASDLKTALVKCRSEERPRTYTVVDHQFRRLNMFDRLLDVVVGVAIVVFLGLALKGLLTVPPSDSTALVFDPNGELKAYYDDQGRARIIMSSKPAGAELYFSQRTPDHRFETVAEGVNSIRTWLAPGDYFVTAIWPDGSFHEVLRTVPDKNQSLNSFTPNNGFLQKRTGVALETVVYHPPEVDDCILLRNVFFQVAPVASAEFPSEKHAQTGYDIDNQGFRVCVSFDDACAYLEKRGMRIPFESELELALSGDELLSVPELFEWTMTSRKQNSDLLGGNVYHYRDYKTIQKDGSTSDVSQLIGTFDFITLRGVRSKSPLIQSAAE